MFYGKWHSIFLVAITVFGCVSACYSDNPQARYKSYHTNATCLKSLQSDRLRHIARKFSMASSQQRILMQKRYQSALDHSKLPKHPRLERLAEYFLDVTNPVNIPLDGAHIPFSKFGDNVRVYEIYAGNTEQLTLDKTIEPLWSGYAIPSFLFVQDYPLFRGDRMLAGEELNLADPLNQTTLEKLTTLFSNGIVLDAKSQSLASQDAYLHSLNSKESNLLSSSTNFDVAKRFGIVPGTKWSAVIEFRGFGVDINKAALYFRKFSFLNAATEVVYNENEVAISRSVPASDIKGVWFMRSDGHIFFIKNANYKL